MVDSELYEDAQSKIESRSKSNTVSIYQDAQSKLNNRSKKILTKRSDSSVYQDAQSHITNNSAINAPKNSTARINQGNNQIEYKKDFLKLNNIYKSENMIDNEEEKYMGRNERYESFENNEEEINNNEEKKSGSLYEEPKGGESGEIEKKATIFEGVTKKGGECCNLPKCNIF